MEPSGARQTTLMLEVLEQTSLFKGLDMQHLHSISGFCYVMLLADGELLIAENETNCRDLYALVAGKVEVVSKGKVSTSSEVAISKQDRDILGEIAWLTGGTRSASIRCVGDVEALRIDGKGLMAYLESHPDAGFMVIRRIAQILADRLNSTDILLKQLLWNMKF